MFHKSSGLKRASEEEDEYFTSSSMPSFIESPSYDPADGSSYYFDPSSASSSYYPSYMEAFQTSTDYHLDLQVNPFSTPYPQSYQYSEKNQEFPFNEVAVLRGPAATKNASSQSSGVDGSGL